MWYAVIGATVIGAVLGLLGSGGSILTVPALTYLLGHDGKVAVAESLGIVGGVALAGVIPFAWVGRVDWRSAVHFALPGMAGTYLGAWAARWVPAAAQLTLLGGVMVGAAAVMLRQSGSRSDREDGGRGPHARWKVLAEGLGVGVLTGLVGVGGGFLIVPALVVLSGLPMRTAVGTSLAVIALQSASGFCKYLHVLGELNRSVDWPTIGLFVAFGVVGSFAGTLAGARLDPRRARRLFAVFLVVMGLFVMIREAPGVFLAGP